VIVPLEFCNWDIEPWVVSMDSVEMAFEATGVSEPMTALSTRNHGYLRGGLGLTTVFIEVGG